MSGKCKRIARHLLFLLWFSWRCKFAEVFAKSTTSKENKANNDLFTFWIRGLFTSAKLHDKLLWLIGGVVCVYTSQLNGTATNRPLPRTSTWVLLTIIEYKMDRLISLKTLPEFFQKFFKNLNISPDQQEIWSRFASIIIKWISLVKLIKCYKLSN